MNYNELGKQSCKKEEQKLNQSSMPKKWKRKSTTNDGGSI